MPFQPGRVIARRYHHRHVTTWVQATVVVRDDEAGLLLWQPLGGPFAEYRDPAGRGAREHDLSLDELPGGRLVRGSWQHGVLEGRGRVRRAYRASVVLGRGAGR